LLGHDEFGIIPTITGYRPISARPEDRATSNLQAFKKQPKKKPPEGGFCQFGAGRLLACSSRGSASGGRSSSVSSR